MSRRTLFTVIFLALTVAIIWYASPFASVPEVTFAKAEAVGDESKKVLVIGKVAERDIIPGQGTISFYMIDNDGTEMRVNFDAANSLTSGQVHDARKNGRHIVVAGHSHGDYFHAKEVNFPAY